LEPDDWLNYLRMDEDVYREILQKVTPRIKKSYTVMRKVITPHERLSVTLRFLATGRLCRFEVSCSDFSTSFELNLTRNLQGNLRGTKGRILKGKKTFINTINQMATNLHILINFILLLILRPNIIKCFVSVPLNGK
jgi:hypothetical protein